MVHIRGLIEPLLSGRRHKNRDRTTELVAPPPGDYESKTAIVSYTELACFQPSVFLTQILGQA